MQSAEVEGSHYFYATITGFLDSTPNGVPLEMTIIDCFYDFFVALLKSTNQSTPRALPALEMTNENIVHTDKSAQKNEQICINKEDMCFIHIL